MRTVAFLSVLTLAACSSGGAGNATGPTGSATGSSGSTSSGAAAAGSVSLTNACADLSREAVQTAIGKPVQSAELADVQEVNDAGLGGSACVFDFGEARLIQYRLNRFPDQIGAGTTLNGTVDLYKNAGEPVEEVPGLGRRAIYTAGSSPSVVIQIDDTVLATITANRLPDVANIKEALLTLARQAVG